MKNLTNILILLFCWPIMVNAQADIPTDLAIDRIKPIEELLRLAEQNLTTLRSLNSTQKIYREQNKITKKKWLQHISATAGVNYGNGIVYDQLSTGDTNSNLSYLTRQNVTYSVGLNLRLPFSEVASRKNEIKINQLEIEKIEGQKAEQKDLIRSEVIRHYKELKNLLKTLEMKAEVLEANDVALKVQENYFKAGKLTVEKYRMALDVSFTAKLEYEKAKNEAWFSVRMLRELVGENILK